MEQEQTLGEAVSSGDRRVQLEALRDFLVHELEVNRCNSCLASKLRTGDTAALVLRLMDVLSKIDELPREDGVVTELDKLRAKRADRTPTAQDSAPTAKRRIAGPGSS